MKIEKGTPGFGMLLGVLLAGLGGLVMWIGLWKTLLLGALFAVGFFLGAVDKKKEFLQGLVNRVIPEKKTEIYDYRDAYARGSAGNEEEKEDKE